MESIYLDNNATTKALEEVRAAIVDALGNEARVELAKITAALKRMESGDYGNCTQCGSPIARERLEVYPYAEDCIDCARFGEHRRAHE